jgi:epoxyqueuosine reductase
VSIRGEKIKSFAKNLGFSFCGIAKAEPLTGQKAYNEDFIRRKLHEPFKYLETNLAKRLDPSKIMPDVKSVIAVLLNYYPDKIIPEEDNFIISKYAYGRDYHVVVKKKIDELIEFISSKHLPSPPMTASPPTPLLLERGEIGGSVKALGFVDSGSVMEKVWAQRCGVGWQGKNTILINKHAGSFFFIGIILTNLELEPDEPVGDHCGACNKCREACPTGALDQPYQLTISKCIAYHTIESKHPIPAEFKGKFNDRIFGCDICQDVCPYNRISKPSGDPNRTPHPDLLRMRKHDWLSLTEDQFKLLFNGTPVFRTGYKRFMENITFMDQGD